MKIIFFLLLFIVLSFRANAQDANEIYRGFNIDANKIAQSDLVDLAKTGANLIRLNFNNLPLVENSPPYKINQDSINKLNLILDWCQDLDIKVIIDPHYLPGMKSRITASPEDLIWTDFKYHDLIINFWDKLSLLLGSRGGVIFAYDLFNEPNYPNNFKKNQPSDWNFLSKRLVSTIRTHDKSHYIIIEPADKILIKSSFFPFETGKYTIPNITHAKKWEHSMKPIEDVELPDDSKLIVSPHIYLPLSFTHQGVFSNFSKSFEYPGLIDGVYWNKDYLRNALAPVRSYQKRNNIPILIGEFSASRWTGDSGNRYLKDLIDIFEENGWSWTYHAYRSAEVWDPEMSNYDRADQTRYITTPRLKMLEKYLSKNNLSSK